MRSLRKVKNISLLVVVGVIALLFFIGRKLIKTGSGNGMSTTPDPMSLANALTALPPPPATGPLPSSKASAVMKQAYDAAYMEGQKAIDAKYSAVDKEYAKGLVTDALTFNAPGFIEKLFSYDEIQAAKKEEQMNFLIQSAQAGDSWSKLVLSHNFPEQAKAAGVYNISYGKVFTPEEQKAAMSSLSGLIKK